LSKKLKKISILFAKMINALSVTEPMTVKH